MRNRPGFTLPDVLVSLVVMGVIGASLAQVMTVQSRFYQTQEGRSQARAVSRGATSIMLSELRMIETGMGVVAASPTAITLRVPVEMGIICENNGTVYAAMAPVDSAVLHSGGSSNSNFSGYAWRTSAGSYTYVPGALNVGWNNAAVKCTGVAPNPITPVPGGRLINFTGPIAGAATATPLFLYQEITYSLSNSATVPGAIGLWRTLVSQSLAEEIVAPFDASAVFRFYTDASSTPQSAVPSPLSDLRGIELQLTGINERAGNNNLEERTPLTTSVFFKNRS
jgi:type II secretory pathway pseudopilin PulG